MTGSNLLEKSGTQKPNGQEHDHIPSTVIVLMPGSPLVAPMLQS